MNPSDRWPFYRAPGCNVCDVMPCYFDGKYYLYYLRCGEDPQTHQTYSCTFSARSTTDFVHFSEDIGTNVYGGTGEIIPFDGKYHLFSHWEADGIRHFVGDTPYHFTDTGDRILPDTQYYVGADYAWRDPRILWMEEEQCFWMVVATNVNNHNSVARHGCVALLKSTDMYHWENCPPLYAPLAHNGTYECPDLFKMGDWYYLVYSHADVNKATYYVKSKNPYGPWLMPDEQECTIDSFLFYAGRVASNGKDFIVAAWNPDRLKTETGENCSMKYGLPNISRFVQYEDTAPLGFGGDMIIHKLGQRANGDLTCEPIPTVVENFDKEIPFAFRELQGKPWKVENNTVSVSSPGYYSCALLQKKPERYYAAMTVKVTGKEAGIVIGADDHFEWVGLNLILQPKIGRLNVLNNVRDRVWVGYCMPFAIEQEKFIQPDENGEYHFQIMQDKDVIVVYVNGHALSLRSVDAIGNHIGVYAFDGEATFSDIVVKEVSE